MTSTGTPSVLPLYPHPTIMVLPGGTVYVDGMLITGADDGRDPLDAAWSHVHAVAARCGHAIRVSIGHPHGSVEAYVLDPNGGGPQYRLALPSPPSPTADPRWNQDLPNRHGLMEQVRAADRAGNWSTAQAAATRLAAHFESESAVHPHAAMASELAGYFAARARDWKSATRLCMTAADRRHRLNAPGPEKTQDLGYAVGAWLSVSDDDPETLPLGFELAQLLIRMEPHQAGPIASVLGRITHLMRKGGAP
jgi:hypothetical protein